MKHIDMHVHFRDWSQSEKCTIGEGMALARSQDVVAVGDMPNTNLTREDALKLMNSLSPGVSTAMQQMILRQIDKGNGSVVSEELVELRLRTAEQQGVTKG